MDFDTAKQLVLRKCVNYVNTTEYAQIEVPGVHQELLEACLDELESDGLIESNGIENVYLSYCYSISSLRITKEGLAKLQM